jgi:hypothetical protein
MKYFFTSLFSVLLFVSTINIQPNQSYAAAGFSQEHGTLSPLTPPTPKNGAGRKLLAIYMVGSDLESNYQAGENDLNELFEGYAGLQNPNVDIVIAFGGANKDGWRGMKIATADQLIIDAQDEIPGNEDASVYSYYAPQAHMGDVSSLQLFLEFLRDGYVGYDQRFLTLWDHGASYEGFGNDENYNFDALSLNEIDQAFTNSNAGIWDLIGYDACLMGSIEVASITKKHANYMIASEELEPGHGWQWTAVIQNLSKFNDIQRSGEEMVKNFVQNVHEYSSDGKTLSLVDLRRFDALSQATENIGQTLSSVLMSMSADQKGVIESVSKVRAFGAAERTDQRVSIDLKHLALLLKSKTTDATLMQQLNDLINAVDQYVVISRQDGTRPDSFGVSITAPEQKASVSSSLGADGVAAFQIAYANVVSGDTEPPMILEQDSDANADDFEFDDQEFDDGFDEVDPLFYEWLDELEDEIFADYEDGILTDDELETALEELESLTEDNPDYLEWLDFVLADDEYEFSNVPDWFVLFEQSAGGDQKVANPNRDSVSFKFPFTQGERSAFVAKPRSSGSVNASQVEAGITGISVTFEDENLKRVSTLFGNVLTFDADEDGNLDDWFLTIAGVQAYPTSTEGRYFTPQWNQHWYFMDYSDTEEPAYIPMYFDRINDFANYPFTIYKAEIDYQDSSLEYSDEDLLTGSFEFDEDGEPVELAELEIVVSPSNHVVHHEIRSYRYLENDPDDLDDDSILYDKNTRKLKVGDKVRFFSLGINLTREGLDYWFPESDLITVEKEIDFFVDLLQFDDLDGNPLDYFYAVQAEDIADNITLTELAPAAVVDDTPGTAVPNWELY